MPAPQRPRPNAPPPPGSARRGKIDAVPCPHCGRPLDFRDNADETLGGTGWGGDGGLETGSMVTCDHCNRLCKVIAVERVTLVTLAPAR